MRDLFAEIFSSMRHSKTRLLLTGLSTAWGIFLLIVLLGTGNGILNGISNAWLNEDDNVVTIEPSTTMLPYEGLPVGRSINITEEDGRSLQNAFPDNIEGFVPELDLDVTVSYRNKYSETDIAGFYPGYEKVRNNVILAGRNINDIDIASQRKVCLVSTNLCKRIFPGDEPQDIVGRTVSVNEVAFTVVGVYRPAKSYNVSRTVIAPFTTIKSLYFDNDDISKLSVTVVGLNTEAQNNAFVEKMRAHMASRKQFSPQDKKAVTITNTYDLALYIGSLFKTINLFLWIVGLSTLVAGIVGVSNIMLITVRERTRELAVRKAMGAPRRSIIALVLTESVLVTVIFGYIGMVLGIGVIKLADIIVSAASDPSSTGVGSSVFMNPSVDIGIVLGATLIMIIAGLLAGYMPAKKAVSIKLVEALAAND
ncbi:MAG: ABC transporter permease [Bacteroidales bacterium]|nr:ABC transporter permease [Bacteroidales bacterium]